MCVRIAECIHDFDQPGSPSNIAFWMESRGLPPSIKIWPGKDKYPENLPDLVFLHGGVQHVWDKAADPWLKQEVLWVRRVLEQGVPVIGFCLGAQILAEALGGTVYRQDWKETGFYKIEPSPQGAAHPLLNGLEQGFSSFLWHEDHYTLPGDCVSLAYTAGAPNQIVVSRHFPAASFQFHPEYTRRWIQTYVQECRNENWTTEAGGLPADAFLAELALREDTFTLFEKLIENTLKWFGERFGRKDGGGSV